MIHEILKKLGLDDNEIEVYLKLLQSGSQIASVVAYQMRQPRTTIQTILRRLEKEKLVTSAIVRKQLVFSPVHPSNLSNIVEMARRKQNFELKNLAEELDEIMPDLVGMMKNNKSIPNVKFYQGIEGVREVLFDTLKSKTELKDFANIDAMFEYVKPINDEYVTEREKTSLRKRSLLLDTPFAHQVYESGKYSPKSHKGYKWINSSLYPFAIEMNIYDGKVSYLTYVKDDFVGVIIENEHIYRMHDSMWNLMWDILPEPPLLLAQREREHQKLKLKEQAEQKKFKIAKV